LAFLLRANIYWMLNIIIHQKKPITNHIHTQPQVADLYELHYYPKKKLELDILGEKMRSDLHSYETWPFLSCSSSQRLIVRWCL